MPRLTVDLNRIEQNARLVAALLQPHDIRLVGVTKACLGNEMVGKAMLAGGAAALADSRIESLANLRRYLPGAELQLMRSPVSGGPFPADTADYFFVSSAVQADALLATRPRHARPIQLCLMIETGDGREGTPPGLAAREAAAIASSEGMTLAGLATNAACARPRASMEFALKAFKEAVIEVKRGLSAAGLGCGFDETRDPDRKTMVSAGGSGLLGLLAAEKEREKGLLGAGPFPDDLFEFVTDLRCGEAILLGRLPAGKTPGLFLPQAHRDAFIIDAPVLEVFEKAGTTQALAGLGVQDIGHGAIVPLDAGVCPAKITSDYLKVRLSADVNQGGIAPGSRLRFIPSYYTLLAAMTSPFVEKVFRGAD